MHTDRRISAGGLVRQLGGRRDGSGTPAYLGLADRIRLLVLDGLGIGLDALPQPERTNVA